MEPERKRIKLELPRMENKDNYSRNNEEILERIKHLITQNKVMYDCKEVLSRIKQLVTGNNDARGATEDILSKIQDLISQSCCEHDTSDIIADISALLAETSCDIDDKVNTIKETLARPETNIDMNHDKIKNILQEEEIKSLQNKLDEMQTQEKLQRDIRGIIDKINSKPETQDCSKPDTPADSHKSQKLHDSVVTAISDHLKSVEASESMPTKLLYAAQREHADEEKMKQLEHDIKSLLVRNSELKDELNEALCDKESYHKLPNVVKSLAELFEQGGSQAQILRDLVTGLTNHGGRNTWAKETKALFGILLNSGGRVTHDILKENLCGPSLQVTYRYMRPSLEEKCASSVDDIDLELAKIHLEHSGYCGPYQVAVDATAVIQTIRVNLQEKKLYGLCCGSVSTGSFEEMENAIKENQLASQVYAFILSPMLDGIEPYILAIVPVKEKESAETVGEWQKTLTHKAIHSGLHLIGFAADGDSKIRKHWSHAFSPKPGDNPGGNGILHDYSLERENFVLPFPDVYHLIKKLRNQVLNVKRLLRIGNKLILLEHMKDMWCGDEKLKHESKLWQSDLNVKDKQNVPAALRFFHQNARCVENFSLN